jgi:hypothetical protein
MSINPMQSAHAAPRCSARSKRTGQQCRAPAVRGFRVCRMHGARGGAPTGKQNGNYRHGGRTKEAIASMREVRELIRLVQCAS